MNFQRPIKSPRDPLNRTFYLPRLSREHYQADAVVFWTLTVFDKAKGWLTPTFHQRFRELMFHAAAREGLVCPVYCLMPDHLHLVWMGLRLDSDQINGMAFLRTYLNRNCRPRNSSRSRRMKFYEQSSGNGICSQKSAFTSRQIRRGQN